MVSHWWKHWCSELCENSVSGRSLTRELLTRGVVPTPGQEMWLLLVRQQLLVCLCVWHIDDLILRLISNESHFLLDRLNIANCHLLPYGHYRGSVYLLILRLGHRLLPRSASCNCCCSCCSCACNALLLRLGHRLCRRSRLGRLGGFGHCRHDGL